MSTKKKLIVDNKKGIYRAVDDPLAGLGAVQKFFARLIGVDTALQSNIPDRTSNKETRMFGGKIQTKDRLFALKRTPIGHKIVWTVSEDIWDKGFKIINEDDPQDQKLDKAVQQKLQDLHAKDALTQLTVYERAFGWSILVLGYTDSGELEGPVENPVDIEDLAAYTEIHVTNILEDTDADSSRFGLPEHYRIFGRSSTRSQDIHWSRCIHCATRVLDDRYKGISVIDWAYDDMLSSRWMSWSAMMTLIRYGSGFPDITLEHYNQDQIDSFVDSGHMDNINAMRYFVHNERQNLEFKGLEGKALDPTPYFQIPLERLSMATDLPKNVLRGAQAGSLTGSQTNERAYFKYISDQQERYLPVLRTLIRKLLRVMPEYKDEAEDISFTVEFNPGFVLSEENKSMIALRQEQANKLKTTYMTVNEIRREQELDPVEGGDVVLGLAQAKAVSLGLSSFGPDEALATDADMSLLEKNLNEAIQHILDKVKNNDITPEEAELEAEMVIDEVIRRIRHLIIMRMEDKLNRPVTELAPEVERRFITMKKRYLADFRSILEDQQL